MAKSKKETDLKNSKMVSFDCLTIFVEKEKNDIFFVCGLLIFIEHLL